jgi:hypothetical protein
MLVFTLWCRLILNAVCQTLKHLCMYVKSPTQEKTFDQHSVASLNNRYDCRKGGGGYRFCHKCEFLSQCDVVFLTNTGRHILGVSVLPGLSKMYAQVQAAEYC